MGHWHWWCLDMNRMVKFGNKVEGTIVVRLLKPRHLEEDCPITTIAAENIRFSSSLANGPTRVFTHNSLDWTDFERIHRQSEFLALFLNYPNTLVGPQVSVKAGTPRNTLRTPRNTPEHPPDGLDTPRTPLITKIRKNNNSKPNNTEKIINESINIVHL